MVASAAEWVAEDSFHLSLLLLRNLLPAAGSRTFKIKTLPSRLARKVQHQSTKDPKVKNLKCQACPWWGLKKMQSALEVAEVFWAPLRRSYPSANNKHSRLRRMQLHLGDSIALLKMVEGFIQLNHPSSKMYLISKLSSLLWHFRIWTRHTRKTKRNIPIQAQNKAIIRNKNFNKMLLMALWMRHCFNNSPWLRHRCHSLNSQFHCRCQRKLRNSSQNTRNKKSNRRI